MAPVGYTCRDIDYVLRLAKDAKSSLAGITSELEYLISRTDDDEASDRAKDIIRLVEQTMESFDITDFMEQLRGDNAQLRQWGISLEKEVANLEEKLANYEELV